MLHFEKHKCHASSVGNNGDRPANGIVMHFAHSFHLGPLLEVVEVNM